MKGEYATNRLLQEGWLLEDRVVVGGYHVLCSKDGRQFGAGRARRADAIKEVYRLVFPKQTKKEPDGNAATL